MKTSPYSGSTHVPDYTIPARPKYKISLEAVLHDLDQYVQYLRGKTKTNIARIANSKEVRET